MKKNEDESENENDNENENKKILENEFILRQDSKKKKRHTKSQRTEYRIKRVRRDKRGEEKGKE